MDFFNGILANGTGWWTWPLVIYAAIEINFYLVFKFYLVPRANKRTPPQPFRAFGCHDGKDRFMLMRRILDRLERTCAATGEDMLQATAEYMARWFRFHPHTSQDHKNHPRPPPTRRVSTLLTDSESSSSSGEEEEADDFDDGSCENDWEDCKKTFNSSIFSSKVSMELNAWNDAKLDGCEKTNIFKWALHTLCYDDVNDLLACFFMGKSVDTLEDWERVELKKLFDYLENHFALKVQPGRSPITTPRRLTQEDVNAWHRPLAVYAGVYAMQLGKAGALWLLGFSHNVTSTGLQYWYRPERQATKKGEEIPNPLLFFHGIAPGGSTIYLPMLLSGVANDGRAMFLFENPSVSCHPSFKVITEDETIEGVQEALDKHNILGDLALMGHSFGSFQLTWLIYSPLRPRIRQFALLDPVSILLSEPDLAINFDEATPLFKLVLTELWTNFYIRRYFSWYRSELWLDDMPENVDFFVGLAEKDQIVNGPKVKREVEIFGSEHPSFARQTTIAFWDGALHGDCLYQWWKWRDIRRFFDNAECKSTTQFPPSKQKVC
ncbi:expressed unknown protein [Seminavis robusta]|uniref:AB hydrolase-1 domain-containing protein n=1 Tax=Seminavis robusta TaxID=568900 RepID=A0A9N8H1I6_9STRA|nr:expressed unknown protein [Seminavis robusta]|eukprot:Sro4_g003370.1 n/a (550) ;mRNA; f:132686-134427